MSSDVIGICPWCHQDLPSEISSADTRVRPAERWPGQRAGLTPRESQVIDLVAQGMSNLEISAALYLGLNTVKTYIRTSYRKMGVDSRGKAVRWAVNNGFDVTIRD